MLTLRQRYLVLKDVPGRRTAQVRIARDRLTGRTVVIKTVPSGHDLAAELQAEGMLIERLQHPALVQSIERFVARPGLEDQPVSGLVTGWVDGSPLPAWAAGRGRLEQLSAFVQLLEAVGYLHRSGWLHLDLKPDNVLGTAEGPVVLDLGSARPVDTLAGTAGGTLGYAAPEVLLGQAPALGSDLFSLGVMLYEMLTGASPWAEQDGGAVREAVLAGRFVPVRVRATDIPPALVEVITSLLETDVRNRPAGVSDLRDVLTELGVPWTEHVGGGPLLGRDTLVADLLDELSQAPQVAALIGAPGSGRSRVAREVLTRWSRTDNATVLDLSREPRPLRALESFLELAGAPGKGSLGDARLPGFLAARRLGGLAYLGQVTPDPAELASLTALAAGGFTTVVSATGLTDWALPWPLPGLSPEELVGLAYGAGRPADALALHLARQSAGHPGRFLSALVQEPADLQDLDEADRARWRHVRLLPDNLPYRALSHLDVDTRDALDRCVELGLASTDGGWLTFMAPGDLHRYESVDPAWRQRAQRLLDGDLALDTLQQVTLMVLVGDMQSALSAARRLDRVSRPDARSLAFALVEAVGAPALDLLVRCYQGQKSASPALAVVERFLRDAPDDPHIVATAARARLSFDREGAAAQVEAFRVAHGVHPDVLGIELWYRTTRPGDDLDEIFRFCGALEAESPGILDHPKVLPWYMSALRKSGKAEHRQELEARCDRLLADYPDLDTMPLVLAHSAAAGLKALGRNSESLPCAMAFLRRTDEEGNMSESATARLTVAITLQSAGRAREARQLLVQALQMNNAVGHEMPKLKVLATLAELEILLGRLPSAERCLQQMDDLLERLGSFAEAQSRMAILMAAVEAGRGEHEAAVARLRAVDLSVVPSSVVAQHHVYLMESELELGHHEAAYEVVQSFPHYEGEEIMRRLHVARGRVHLGLARRELRLAMADVGEQVLDLHRASVGAALLAFAGEDLDPESFGQRREALKRASELLPPWQQSRAIALRERLLEGPGAALEQVVGLIEAIGQGPRFLEGLAQVVADALSANRVLVMLRLPGLGRQVSVREISGQEAAGLAPEVLRRLRKPDDVWQASDAFADPELRRMSATVRTFQIKNVIAVAIPRDGKVIGALYVDDLHRAGHFDQEDVRMLQRLARAIGTVAEVIPTQAVSDGLKVHDLHGVYLCDDQLAGRIQTTLERAGSMNECNLLVTGPTGAGKTWVARRIATEVLGTRGLAEIVLRPSDPDKLVSLLWGTRRGEFTGALDTKGAIHRAWAEGKTLFLDEVQNLDEAGQRVLLPLLELPHRRFGAMTGEANALQRPLHIILGTNADIEGSEWRKAFREDLWFRMSGLHVHLPPLAQRGREAVYRHLGDLLKDRQLPAPEHVFEREALQRLATHSWPGNLRALTGFVDQAAWHWHRDERPLSSADIDVLGLPDERTAPEASPLRTGLQDAEARALLETLAACDWVQSVAAERLGLSKFALHRALKRLDLIDHVREMRHR